MVNENLLATYSLLSFIRDTYGSECNESLTQLFVPLIKETLNRMLRKKGTAIMGKDYSEIFDSVRENFQIEIPIPVIITLMPQVCKYSGGSFTLNSDHSFIIDSECTSTITEDYQNQKKLIKKLANNYKILGNILYALFIRRLSNKALAVLVVLLGMALASFAVFNVSGYGNMGVGWTLDGVNFLGGTLRMLFPFSLGMLMSRNFKPMKVNGAFWICTIILIALFSVPYLEGLEPICMNGIYEAFCVIAVFPFLVWLGASGTTTDKQSTKICKFLGDISYPVYVVHYPLMYLFYAWLIENKLYTLGETWYVAVGVFVLSVILACLCLKLYDEPVRKWLSKKFLAPK